MSVIFSPLVPCALAPSIGHQVHLTQGFFLYLWCRKWGWMAKYSPWLISEEFGWSGWSPGTWRWLDEGNNWCDVERRDGAEAGSYLQKGFLQCSWFLLLGHKVTFIQKEKKNPTKQNLSFPLLFKVTLSHGCFSCDIINVVKNKQINKQKEKNPKNPKSPKNQCHHLLMYKSGNVN